MAADLDLALPAALGAREHAQERGLAHAGGAEESQDLAGRHLEAQALEQGGAGAKSQAVDAEAQARSLRQRRTLPSTGRSTPYSSAMMSATKQQA